MRVALVAVVLTACSFEHGSIDRDGAIGGGGDGSDVPDGSNQASCVDAWIAGPTFTTPMPITSINSAGDEADPFISHDELTIYFVRNDDIFVATRGALDTAFGPAAKDTNLSTQSTDTKLSMTADGFEVYIDTARPNGVGATDIWHGVRTAGVDTFTWDQKYLTAVNTDADQWDPHISANGLRLYYAPTGNPQTIVVAKRNSVIQDFAGPTVISELDSNMVDNDPTLSGDERVIVFASNRGGNRNLWYATRASVTNPFMAPKLVPMINTATDDGGTLSEDACRLYFVSDRNGNSDIFVTSIQ